MDLGLDRARALVTGGSRGIGRAVVEALLAEGATVAFSARDAAGVEAAQEEIGSDRVRGDAVDVADGDALAAWVGEVRDALGGLDVVVANASAGGAGGATDDAFRNHLQVDVLGLVHLVDAARDALVASERGAIVSISTTAAVEHFGSGVSAYNSLKAAVVNYTAGLAQSLAGEGVRANCVSPGPVMIGGGAWDRIRESAPAVYEGAVASSPSGRLGSAEEVARAVTFLASPAASWITGENLVVDGGFTRRVAY